MRQARANPRFGARFRSFGGSLEAATCAVQQTCRAGSSGDSSETDQRWSPTGATGSI